MASLRRMYKTAPVEAENARPIVRLKRGPDGLFIEPTEIDPVMIAHNLERMVKHFGYADEFTGDGNTFDPQGDYNCGRCNQADNVTCLLIKLKISRAAGSCRHWESIRAGDPELMMQVSDRDAAVYGVAANGKGFGCARCPYSKPSKHVDDLGRRHWCGKGAIHQMPNGCCELNGAAVLKSTRAA